MKNFKINNETGELRVFGNGGYISVLPYLDGVAVMSYNKDNVDGTAWDEDGIPGIDLAIIEEYEGKLQACVWKESACEDYTHKIEYNRRLKNK